MRCAQFGAVLLVLAGCDRGERPHEDARAAHVEPVVAADAREIATSADAAIAKPTFVPCVATERSVHAFRFGRLTAPAGWCWRRTEEGDDLSGVLLDGHAQIRMRYDELAFDEKVGDACDAKRPGVTAIRVRHASGVAYRACTVADRACFSFGGAANLCSEPPEQPDFTPVTLIDALVPRGADHAR